MARSLTVQHEEHVGTTPLLTGFLLFAALVVALTAFGDAGPDAEVAPAVDVSAQLAPSTAAPSPQ